MRRKALVLTPVPASICFEQAADRFQQATLILQQIAARVDAADQAQAEEAIAQEGARTADTTSGGTTQKSP